MEDYASQFGSKATGCVTNVNTCYHYNVLYPSKSMSKFTMVSQI